MAERTAAVDPAVDELRRKARRRLMGAIVLALAAAVILPMLLEKEPRPLGEDVAVQIPPVDEGRFVNRLSSPAPAADAGAAQAKPPAGEPPRSPTTMPNSSGPNAGASSGPPVSPAAATTPGASSPSTGAATSEGSVAVASAPARAGATQPGSADSVAVAGAKKSVADVEQHVMNPSAAVPAPVVKPERSTDAEVEPTRSAVESRVGVTPAAASSRAKPTEAFVVQLAAFSDDKGANALASRLKRNGYAAYTEPVKTGRGTLYRVRVGGYATREAAGDARTRLKSQGYSGIVATR